MNIEIHQPELESLIEQRMKTGAYRSVEDFLMHALITGTPAHGIDPPEPLSTSQNLDDNRPIWEVITDVMKNVPDEVFDQLPKDGASQVDHIYGLPKRD